MPRPENKDTSASEENYLKTIFYQTRTGQPTSTLALAEALGIRPASVTNMLQKLAKAYPELVTYRKRYGISLTPEGEKEALRVIRHHRLIEQFLYQILEYPLDKIHPEAERLEHAVSPYFIDRMAQLLQEPVFDPHGHPIPDSNLVMEDSRQLVYLSTLNTGEKGIVRQIMDQNPELLTFLNSIGLFPGEELEIIKVNPIDGTQQIFLSHSRETHVLGRLISTNVQVEIKHE